MSLINDALKKAREAQQTAPPPPASEPRFKPAEPDIEGRHRFGVAVPIALALLALAGLALVWRVSHQPSRAELQNVQAKSPATPDTAQPPAPVRAADAVENQAPDQAAAASPSAAQSSPPASATRALAPTNAAPAEAALPITNVVPVAAAPTRPAPKLQGIVYNPKRPSALIDGKTLFVGDRFGAFRVMAISHDTVTLTGAGVTNLLSLSD